MVSVCRTTRSRFAFVLSLAIATLFMGGCGGSADDGKFTLSSPVISDGGALAARFTCEGPGNSPPLAWRNQPSVTKSFALKVEDLNVGQDPFVHWLLYNLPGSTASLPESQEVRTPNFKTATQGKNGLGHLGYTDICPPKGSTMHHYRFMLYALDTSLPLPSGATREELMAAMQGHILGQAQFTADFYRPENPINP